MVTLVEDSLHNVSRSANSIVPFHAGSVDHTGLTNKTASRQHQDE